jgi:tetratricopeptide (TPR) repeat protein
MFAATSLLFLLAVPATAEPDTGGSFEPLLAESQQQRANYLNHQGIVAQNNRDFVVSINTFQEALLLSTKEATKVIIRQNLAVSYSLQGKEEYERGNYVTAAALFEQALEQPPALPDRETVQYNISESYYRAARAAHDRHDLVSERDMLQAAIKYDPREPRLGWRDRVLDEIGRRQEAIQNVKRYLEVEPAEKMTPASPQQQQDSPWASEPQIIPGGNPLAMLINPFVLRRMRPPAWQGQRFMQAPLWPFMRQRPFIARPGRARGR